MARPSARAAHSPTKAAGMFKMAHAEDPRQKLLNAIGNMTNIAVMGCQVIVATYKRPEATQGGIITKINTEKEDEFQSKVGLVVKLGPRAFVEDADAKFGEPVPKLWDWVIFSPDKGLASSIRGVHCRFLQDVHIDAIIENPDDIW